MFSEDNEVHSSRNFVTCEQALSCGVGGWQAIEEQNVIFFLFRG